jgi:molecular chaperone GrpE
MADTMIQAELQSCREALATIEARWEQVIAAQEANIDLYRKQVEAELQAELDAYRRSIEAEWEAKLDDHRQRLEAERDAEIDTYRKRLEAEHHDELSAYRKRVEREAERVRQHERETVLRDWLDVVDNLERALIHRDRAALARLWEGLLAIYQLAQSLLKRYEVTRIPTRGMRFDPAVHEAVGRAHGAPDGAIVEEVEAGYRIADTILRPARVIVAVQEAPRRTPYGV